MTIVLYTVIQFTLIKIRNNNYIFLLFHVNTTGLREQSSCNKQAYTVHTL